MQLPLHTATSGLFINKQKNEVNPKFSLFVWEETEQGEMLLREAWKKEKRPWVQAAVSKFLFGHQAKLLGQCLKCHY